MTILEHLNVINSEFIQLHNSFMRLDKEKHSLSASLQVRNAKIHEKWNNERSHFLRLKEDVVKYYRIAKENSKKELVTSGLPAKKPDIAKLNEMVELIRIDLRDDPLAGELIDLASRYVIYINNEIARIDAMENAEINNSGVQNEKEINVLLGKKKKILSDCENYLRGNEVKDLVKIFETIHRDYEINSGYFEHFCESKKHKHMMLFGFQQFELDVPQKLCGVVKASFGEHFDEKSKMINCPCGIITDSPEEIRIEYVDRNEAKVKKGLQALILNYLRYFLPSEFRVSILDSVHFNGDILGPLSPLAAEKHSVIERIPYDTNSSKKNIAILADYYRNVEAKIGALSVFEYNKTQSTENRIPFRILIINRTSTLHHTYDEPDMAYLINNAIKFAITVVFMEKSLDGGSKGKDRENKYLEKSKDFVQIISDSAGNFYIENNIKWMSFKWLDSPERFPSGFLTSVVNSSKPTEIGSKYFKRFSPDVPVKSRGKRRPIVLPFAIDEDDNVISCRFEEDMFAAYIMGAAGSGKSTLLHTIICSLIMNYHPDEVELWLMDFKMLEFKRYVNHLPPHVKYILLEKSEDLVFDIIDNLTVLLDNRQFIFSQRGWSKLADVPPEENIPAIFVIIDEFAQMSQILKETKGSGYGSDYTLKLENLLAKGRALGIKFIFASQTYTTGISGLTETACKQIQLRFALKNTTDEIKQTLNLSSDQISARLSNDIISIQPYETIFKWSDDKNKIHIGKYCNMYTEYNEVECLVDKINSNIKSISAGHSTADKTYIEKKPVLIDGSIPKSFKSQMHIYRDYEASLHESDLDENDILIYPGVPCSFTLARPFVLASATAENILLAGGSRDNLVNVVLSILNSYLRGGYDVEIWTHERSPIFKRYRSSVFAGITQYTKLEEICGHIQKIKQSVQKKRITHKLVICFGYELLAFDMDVFGSGLTEPEKPKQSVERPAGGLDLNAILTMTNNIDDEDEKRKLFAEYNNGISSPQNNTAQNSDNSASESGVYDARSDMKWIVRSASNFGLHFLFCFEKGQDFLNVGLDETSFRHKILFSMSKDEALALSGSRKANEIEDGTFVYTDGKDTVTFRPHIYRQVTCNGWVIDDNGNIVQKV